jgi:hypothetical protein
MSSISALRTNPTAGLAVQLLQSANAKASSRDLSAMPALLGDDRTSKAVSTIIRILMDAKGNTAVTADAPDATVSVSTGDGDDAVSINANAADMVESGAGNDAITIHTSGGLTYWDGVIFSSVSRIYAGNGNDVLSIAAHGSATNVDGGDGNDAIAITSTKTNQGPSDLGGIDIVNGGAGDDRLALSAASDVTRVYGDSGDDAIAISASRFVWQVDGGDGNDQIAISAAGVGHVYGGDGNDTINVAARSLDQIYAGFGDDVVAVNADRASRVHGEDGNDLMQITAANVSDVDGGDGDDTIIITGDRIASVHGGAGNDRIVLNNTGDRAADVFLVNGEGHDLIETNGPLAISRFNDDGTQRLDMGKAKVTQGDDGTLTIGFSDSADTMTVKLTGAMAGTQLAFDISRDGRSLVIHAAGQPVKMPWQ